MRRAGVLVAVVVLAFAGYYAVHGARHKPAPPGATAEGPKAPALTLMDLDGNRIDTAGLAGNVVLVNFWAAWCTPCTEEVPKLVALQEKYRDRGLRIVGVSMDDSESALREFCRKNRMNYPVIVGNAKIAESYGGILGLPTSLLISRGGQIRARYPGLADLAKLEQEVVVLLGANR